MNANAESKARASETIEQGIDPMNPDQWDEILSQITGKLRKELPNLRRVDAQFLIELPNERLIAPIVEAIKSEVTPRIKLNVVNKIMPIGSVADYDGVAIETWEFKGQQWLMNPYPGRYGGFIRWCDFDYDAASFSEIAEALLTWRIGNPDQLIVKILKQSFSFALPQVNQIIEDQKNNLLLHGNNFFFVDFGYGYEYIAVVRPDARPGAVGWRKTMYCFRSMPEERLGVYDEPARLFYREAVPAPIGPLHDLPTCPNCGHVGVRNGAMYKCLNCGESLGCG